MSCAGGQSIVISASASILPMNIQGWFLQDWLVWSPCGPRDSQESSPGSQFESITSLAVRLLDGKILTSTYDYWKNHRLDYTDLCHKVMSLLFNMLSSLVIAFLPRSKHLLIPWLLSLSAVALEPKKIKSAISNFSPSVCHEVIGLDAIILSFLNIDL